MLWGTIETLFNSGLTYEKVIDLVPVKPMADLKVYMNIANLFCGIVDWESDGLPLKKDLTEQLDGSCVCQLRPRLKIK
jgi:hypothetical protein